MPTYEARQSPTRNTLVCASRTNNTYTFPALPRKILSGWYITKISLSTRTCLVVRTYMRIPALSGTNSSRGLCELVCPSRTNERGGEGYCVKEGEGEEGERERERAGEVRLYYSLGY